MTPEIAHRILDLKADPGLQARVEYLADRNTEGLLTPDEAAEYGAIVSWGTHLAILKSKARRFLDESADA